MDTFNDSVEFVRPKIREPSYWKRLICDEWKSWKTNNDYNKLSRPINRCWCQYDLPRRDTKIPGHTHTSIAVANGATRAQFSNITFELSLQYRMSSNKIWFLSIEAHKIHFWALNLFRKSNHFRFSIFSSKKVTWTYEKNVIRRISKMSRRCWIYVIVACCLLGRSA